MSPVILQLYNSTSNKYWKLKKRLDKAVRSGRFRQLTRAKQSSLLAKLRRLFERLKNLQAQLKIAGAAMAFSIFASLDSQGQSSIGPFVRNDGINPLPAPYTFRDPRPAAVDIDNDGDLDLFVGEYNGQIRFFENTAGPGSLRRFSEPASNPFAGVDLGYVAAPAFVDVDGDGDYDALVGNSYGDTYFFRNTGSQTNPVFTEQTGVSNPFDGIKGTGNSKYGYQPATPTFVDIDGDLDFDLFIGSSYVSPPGLSAIAYYENNAGVFTQTSHPLVSALQSQSNVRLAFADVDGDLDMDAFFSFFGEVRLRINNGATFDLANGVWNPVAKTGSPLYNIGFSGGGAPLAADMDGDGDIDILVGQSFFGSNYTYPEINSNLVYFENTDGNFTLNFVSNLNASPTGGVDVGSEASPTFIDLDNDGDLDAVIGTKYLYDDQIFVFEQTASNVFEPRRNHPLTDILNPLGYTPDVNPVFADIDNDGDNDLFVARGSNIVFFRNNAGTFTFETTPFPGVTSGNTFEASLALLDVDNDGDLDAIIGNSSGSRSIDYFENQGDATIPNFVAATPPVPFNTISLDSFNPNPNVRTVDLDNDGDTDIALSETYYNGGYYYTHVRFFSNNGDGTFTEASSPIIADAVPGFGNTSFFDIDGDGDLDAVLGNGQDSPSGDEDGRITVFENTNPPPAPVFSVTSVNYAFGSGAVTVDASITLSDTDNDLIAEVRVQIQNYQTGDVLNFTPQGGVTGSFDTGTGILTLSGLAPVATYQQILRSITYQFAGAKPISGGKANGQSGRTTVVNKSIAIQAFDSDFTTPSIVALSVSVTFPNDVPVLAAGGSSPTYSGSDITIDPGLTAADADDVDLTSAQVIINPSSFAAGDQLLFSSQNGITSSYDNTTGVLTLTGTSTVANYQTALRSVQFRSTQPGPLTGSRTIEFIVNDGEADSNLASTALTIDVPFVNQPPVITPSPLTTVVNGQVSIDLLSITSDSDNNLDPSTFAIFQQPASGATASINLSTSTLTVDYSSTSFEGADNLIVEVFDVAGGRGQATINIQVDAAPGGSIIVRNGISPNNDGKNDHFQLENITSVGPQNNVKIFNRWGDKVFEIDNYDNLNRRFEGVSDDGKDLSSGVYFYRIEFTNGLPSLEGYLTLKR